MFKLSQLTFEVSENAVSLLSDFLLGLGSQGVAEDIKENGMYDLSAYFPMDADLDSIMKNLKEYIAFINDSMPGTHVGAIKAEHIDRSSWEVWRTVLGKVRAGKRIIIIPPWEDHTPSENEIVIEINPSPAFGTGHHETTRLCIEAIEEIAGSGGAESMLDVGCGSGILSISAYKLGIEKVTGFDTDPVAVAESKKNALKNSVADEIRFFCGYIQSATGVYDLIVANVYMEPIYLMREEFKSRLSEDGKLVLSGIPHIRRDEAVRGLVKAGFILDKESRDGDWVALRFRPR